MGTALALLAGNSGQTRKFGRDGTFPILLRPPQFCQHALAQDAVGARLVSLAFFLQPRDHVRIQPLETACFTGR